MLSFFVRQLVLPFFHNLNCIYIFFAELCTLLWFFIVALLSFSHLITFCNLLLASKWIFCQQKYFLFCQRIKLKKEGYQPGVIKGTGREHLENRVYDSHIVLFETRVLVCRAPSISPGGRGFKPRHHQTFVVLKRNKKEDKIF